MNASVLNFTPRIDEEEKSYTKLSLEPVKNTILQTLDIVEVARKLWIELQELPRDSDEWQNYGSTDVYTGDCPRCSEGKWELRVFSQRQTFGCLNCHWEWEYTDHMNIFQLLIHSNESLYDYDYGYNHDYETDQKHIEKFFELFPEELSLLVWRDLNRYKYNWWYPSFAEEYYPRIEEDLKNEWSHYHRLEKHRLSLRENNDIESNIESIRNSWEKIRRLTEIISSYRIISLIYTHREIVNKIVHTQSPKDIWLESGIPDIFLEERDVYYDLPSNTEHSVWKLDKSMNVGLHFKAPVDSIEKQVRESIELPSWVYGNNEERDEHHYIEIPDATFHSHIIRPEFPNIKGDPAVWNYIIAYSAEENNFSIFLSPKYKTEELREFELIFRNPSWQEGSIPEFKIQHLVWQVEGGIVYGNRFPRSGDNTPVLPEGYKEVATGGWIYTGIGMYFSFGKDEFSKEKHNNATLFDKNLFYNCVENITDVPVFTDKNQWEFISEFTYKIWEPRLHEAARRNYPQFW